MSDNGEIEALIAGLLRLQNQPGVPSAARNQAAEMVERLNYGVRLAILGPPNAGKSSLCDALLARMTAPSRAQVTRVFGPDAAQTPARLPGAVERIDVHDTGLGRVQIIDLHCGADEMAQAAREVLNIADVVLWCTHSFGPQEAAIWAEAPDALKDHSFLVLTKADLLVDKGALQGVIATLSPVVSEEFHSLYPVTVQPLRHFLDSGAEIPAKALTASGLAALIDTVRGVVQAGLRADQDSAALFLERHGGAAAAFEATAERGAPFAKADATPPQAVANCGRLAPACDAARAVLRDRALDLVEMGFDESDGDMAEVLELCESIAQDVHEAVYDALAAAPELQPWAEAFEEACDKITLTATENDTGSAADAVTILLQLRRDLDQLAVH